MSICLNYNVPEHVNEIKNPVQLGGIFYYV